MVCSKYSVIGITSLRLFGLFFSPVSCAWVERHEITSRRLRIVIFGETVIKFRLVTSLFIIIIFFFIVLFQSPPVPWRSILKSAPFWAILVAHMGQNYGYETLMTELPTFMKQVLHFNIKAVSMPYRKFLYANNNNFCVLYKELDTGWILQFFYYLIIFCFFYTAVFTHLFSINNVIIFFASLLWAINRKIKNKKLPVCYYILPERNVLITAVPRHVGFLDGSQPRSRHDDLFGEVFAHPHTQNRQHYW